MPHIPLHLIERAAHVGAFGQNLTPEPSEAQCRAGNYKMGRVNLYGLTIAIEQPRGSTRSGVDEKSGKAWSSRMAAHYGYINGTKGNDGDCVDCFIGFDTQSERAYVINQNIGGKFDEHKVMLAFPDIASARRAYLDSYERGWDGLESIVPTSLYQLKWWLKNGNTSSPLRPETLPKEGLQTMTRKTYWNSDALPESTTIDQVLYDIRRSDAGAGLLLDSVSIADIIEDAETVLTFDALVSPYAKLERKMELLRGIMERTGDKVKPVAMQITDPFKQRGVAQVAVVFELSDGQTVTIYFHNPDVTPTKMAATDEVISWKWLLNKKDITIVVAPERGADLNIREVARRIMRLAEKNSPAFQRVNGKRAERMQNIQSLKDEISTLETELVTAQHELEVAKVAAETAPVRTLLTDDEQATLAKRTEAARSTLEGMTDEQIARVGASPSLVSVVTLKLGRFTAIDKILENHPDDVESAIASVVPASSAYASPGAEGGKVLAAHAEPTIAQLRDAGYTVAEDTSAPATPEEDAALLKALGEQPHYSDLTLKALIDNHGWAPGYFEGAGNAGRMVSVSRSFVGVGTIGGMAVPDGTRRLFAGYTRDIDSRRYIVLTLGDAEISDWDGRDQDPAAIARQVNESAEKFADDRRAKNGLPAMYRNGAAAEPQQPTEQDLIAAYVRAFGEAAAVLNAAVTAVNWGGITDSATAHAEIDKLTVASRTGQYDIIGKASKTLESIGIKTWDERLSGLRDAPGFAAWGAAMDASSAANVKIQALAKKRLIAAGTAEVAALPADAPLADVAAAIFRKAGIDMGANSPQIVAAIEAKDVALAWSILSNLDNKASTEIFERATGIKLAKTQRDRRPQIDEWAGVTPAQRAELDAQRTEAQNAKEREDSLKWAWNGLSALNVRSSDSNVQNGQEFLKSLFAQGFDEVIARKRGASTGYYVRNAAIQITGVKSKNFNSFLKATLAFGGLRQALEHLGVVEPKIEKTGDEKIAAVDEAYRFTNATDDFKRWLAESVLKDDYSPFVTAKGMDEAAKRHGAEIEWGEFAGASLDDTGLAVATLQQALDVTQTNEPINRADGDAEQADLEAEVTASIKEAIATLTEGNYEPADDEIGGTFDVEVALDSAAGVYAETDKRAIAATKALLKYFRDFLASDAKLAKIPEQVKGLTALLNTGNGGSMDKEQAKQALRSLIDIAINRKAGISDPTPEDAQKLADYAHDARTISDYMTQRIRHTGARNLLRIPELKAKYPHIDNQPAMDSATLDGVDEDGYVGKVKKGEQVLGRIDIGDDGKAMVYVGEAGDERVKGSEGRPFMYSEDDAPEMVEALFAVEEALAAAAQTEAMTGPAKDRMAALKVLTDTGMNLWMSEGQNKAVIAGMMGEEWQFFADKMKELAGVIATMPKTYDQDGKYDEAVAYLHYFRGAGDWYITEKDMSDQGTEQAFGLADLGYGGELGYISIVELAEAGVELDFHFKPKTIGQIKGAPDAGEEQPPPAAANPEPPAAAPAEGTQPSREADQKGVDRALFQSVIDGTVADILAPDLADLLEAAFNRNQGDPGLVTLFEQAVGAYQNAMLAATANLV